MAYSMQNSTSGQVLQNTSLSVTYGSAKLQGFLWKDYTCLAPLEMPNSADELINATLLASISDTSSKDYNQNKENAFLEKEYDF